MKVVKRFLNKDLIKQVRLLGKKEEASFIYTDKYIKRGLFSNSEQKVKEAWYNADAINGKFPWMKFESYKSYKTDEDLLDDVEGIIIEGNKAYLKPRIEIDMSEEELFYVYFDSFLDANKEYEKLLKEVNAYVY